MIPIRLTFHPFSIEYKKTKKQTGNSSKTLLFYFGILPNRSRIQRKRNTSLIEREESNRLLIRRHKRYWNRGINQGKKTKGDQKHLEHRVRIYLDLLIHSKKYRLRFRQTINGGSWKRQKRDNWKVEIVIGHSLLIYSIQTISSRYSSRSVLKIVRITMN